MSKKHTQAVINDILLILSQKADNGIVITEDIIDHLESKDDLKKCPHGAMDILKQMRDGRVIESTSNYPVRMPIKHVTVMKGRFITWELTKKGRNLLAYNARKQ